MTAQKFPGDLFGLEYLIGEMLTKMYRLSILAVLLSRYCVAVAEERRGDPGLREQIRGVWQVRAERLRCGRFDCRITARNRSASFGKIDDEKAISAENQVRILFDEQGVCLEGMTIPSVGLAQRTRSAVTGGAGESSYREEFLATLRDRFSNPQPLEGGLPYRAVRDTSREWHIWDAPFSTSFETRLGFTSELDSTSAGEEGRGYPRAVVFPLAHGCGVVDLESNSEVTIYSALIDAFALSVKPSFISAEFGITSHHPNVDGVSCLAIESSINDAKGSDVRTLWVDPSRDYVVVRSLHQIDGTSAGPQYDISYDRDDSGNWIPAVLTVTLINSYGDALDSISVTRNSFEGDIEISSDVFNWKPTSGMWVNDIQSGQQYYIRPDGSKRHISFSDNYAGLTYADLCKEDIGVTWWLLDRRFRTAVWSFAIRAITWPGILLTIPVSYGVVFGVRMALSCFRARGPGGSQCKIAPSRASIAPLGRSDESMGAVAEVERRPKDPT